jgi:hypothetical protein
VRGTGSEPVPLDRIQYCPAMLREHGLDLREVLEQGLAHGRISAVALNDFD